MIKSELINLFNMEGFEIAEVYHMDKLFNQINCYMVNGDNEIIGLNIVNIDLVNIHKELFSIKTLLFLRLLSVNFTLLKNIKFLCKDLLFLSLSKNDLVEFPKEILTLKNLENLSLSKNNLREFPFEILEFQKLKKLSLAGNKISCIPDNLRKLNLLENLNLIDNNLMIFPKILATLRSLKSLNLTGNNIQNISIEDGSFLELKTLIISRNKINKFPFEILRISSLEILNLSKNQLVSIPKEIIQLKNLNSLNLSKNYIKILPAEIKELFNLETLTLSSNYIKEFPVEITSISNLKNLDLSKNEIEDIPIKIKSLDNLEKLELQNNNIKYISKGIIEIKTLIYLYLSMNKIVQIPKEIDNLKNLRTLNLMGNKLEELPKEIGGLSELISLNISSNHLKELIFDIGKLKKLNSLFLQRNKLSLLTPGIETLERLSRLNLSSNNLNSFPKEIFKLSELEELFFQDLKTSLNSNQINTIPNEFLNLKKLKKFKINSEYLDITYKTAYRSGLKTLINTIKQKMTQGVAKLYEAKLLFVGESGAGKTSMMEKILNKNYKLKTNKNDESTIGINIKKYIFDYKKNNIIKFRTNMWDFGGQQIQYMSHQFFLTPNSLYVLVGNDRKQDTDFDYWFHIINLLSNDSPILVVLNQINHKSISNFDYYAYKKRFNTHKIEQEEINLSNMANGKYEVVKNKIENMLCNLPHIGEELPARWINIRAELDEISQSEFYISFEKFDIICKKYGLSDIDIDTLSKHFHNVGIFLHYSDDMILSDTIFLNPEWVMDGIYSVLADKYVNDNKGKFTKKWLYTFWENHKNKYPKKIKDKLLSLMLKDKFEICYRLDKGEESYISPQLLPTASIQDYHWNYTDNLFYRFQYPFMPKGIISRLIVRLNEFIFRNDEIEFAWQKGVFLEYKNAKALIIEEKTKEGLKVIDISIDGDKIDKLELLSKIKYEIEYIHEKSFENIKYDEMIPCYCNECKKRDKPEYYEFNTLKGFIQKEKIEIQCKKSTDMVSILRLLGNVTNDDENNKDSEILEFIKDMGIKVIINNDINNRSSSSTNIKDSMNMSQTQTVEITISQSINQVLSELSSLKRKVEEDDKEEINEIIEDFKELGSNPSKEEVIESGLMSDLKDKIDEFDEKVQDTNTVIGKTSKALKSAKALGRTYNELASLCCLPNVPFFLVKE